MKTVELALELVDLKETLLELAEKNSDVLIPGYHAPATRPARLFCPSHIGLR